MKNVLFILWTSEVAQQEQTRIASHKIRKRLASLPQQPYVVPKTFTRFSLPLVAPLDAEILTNKLGEIVATEYVHSQGKEPKYIGHYHGRLNFNVQKPKKPLGEKPEASKGKLSTDRELFTNGAKKLDTFDREHAVRYVTYMLARIFSNGEGTQFRPKGKLSSSGHMGPRPKNVKHWGNPILDHVNDICQEAFIKFWQAREKGSFLPTQVVCKGAIVDFIRKAQGEKKAIVAFKRNIVNSGHADWMRANRVAQNAIESADLGTDKITSGYLNITKLEGNARIKTLAKGSGKTAYQVYLDMRKLKTQLA